MNNKKKLLVGGLSTAAVVAGVAMTGGTSAYYYDLERSEGNSLSACSLDLEEQGVEITQTGWAEGGNQSQAPGTQTVSSNDTLTNPGAMSTIKLENLQPGDAFNVKIKLYNNGSCAGELWGDVNFPISDDENGLMEPELEPGVPDPDTNPSDNGEGDLDDYIQMTFAGYTDSFHDIAYLKPYQLDSDFVSDETYVLNLDLVVPEGAGARDGNEIMGDSFTFAIDFAAAQKNKITPTPFASVDLNNM